MNKLLTISIFLLACFSFSCGPYVTLGNGKSMRLAKYERDCHHGHICCQILCPCCLKVDPRFERFKLKGKNTLALNPSWLNPVRDFSEVPAISCYWETDSEIKEYSNKINLEFDTISKSEYQNFKLKYDHKIYKDPTIIVDSTGVFKIKTDSSIYVFESKNDYHSSYYYIGSTDVLNAHIIGRCFSGTCEGYLLDKNKDVKMCLPTSFDAGVRGPFISPDNSYMIVYSTYDRKEFQNAYSYRAELVFYDIGNAKNLNDIKLISNFTTENWSIASLVWVDENSFSLKIYENDATNGFVDYKYLKVKIMERNE
jgi:hypothetical protein